MGFPTKEDAISYGEKWNSDPKKWSVMAQFLYDEWEVYWIAGPIRVFRSQEHFPDKFYAIISPEPKGCKYNHGKQYCDSVEEAAEEEVAAFHKFTRAKREEFDEIHFAIDKIGIKGKLHE